MKNLRQIACLLLVFEAGPVFSQQSARWEESQTSRFSIQDILASTEFQTIILLLLVALASFCLIYLLGAMALGVEDKEIGKSGRQQGRRMPLPGADGPRVPLSVERGAPVLRAAKHRDKDKSPERESNPSSGRG